MIQYQLTGTGPAPEGLCDLLEPYSGAIWWHRQDPSIHLNEGEDDPTVPWIVEGICTDDQKAMILGMLLLIQDPAISSSFDIKDLHFKPLEDRDWVGENQQSFQPIQAGRFYIYPSHWDKELPHDTVNFCIDAGAAFGSGHHATTQGCLMALDGLSSKMCHSVLDMGCGSGILAMAMAHLWPDSFVMAVDCDMDSIKISTDNIHLNGLSDRVTILHSQGFDNAAIGHKKPFDIIAANILAGPLCAMAQDMTSHTALGSCVVLSGLLQTQESDVVTTYTSYGWHLAQRFPIDAWVTLVLERI